jgi:hypothetical protein
MIATTKAPWATDAAGRSVPTHYELDGDVLVQVVEHQSGEFSYPIIADPSVWQVTVCVAAIVAVIASTVVGAAKILKIKKIIQSVGGVKNAASRVIKALKAKGNITAKAKAAFADVGSAIVAMAAEILGINTIIRNCTF